ncbi:hypothetical protein ACIBH1_17305 [Nonomuraea sp. NPDC050663]|uniref:hypothetical protein n=1 Tax=Nonomuraea sp. NPDC050663 TaxID=3364370 RepID=UPI003797ABC0
MNPPQSWLVVDIKHHPMAFLFMLVKPRLFLNNQPVPVRWGRNVIPVVPGQHHLAMHVPYMGRIGHAGGPLRMMPGDTVELEYRAPLTMFNAGALGPAPQQWPGSTAMIVFYAVQAGMAVLILLGVLGFMIYLMIAK